LHKIGAYVAGKAKYVELVAERLTAPGIGKELGPTLGANRGFLQGIYLAPSVVASSLKTAILASRVLDDMGYEVEPKYNEERADIVQNIIFHNPDKLIRYCQGIQSASPIDSFVALEPWSMPGYQDPVIMAYIAYMQGGLTYAYGKLAILKSVQLLWEEKRK